MPGYCPYCNQMLQPTVEPFNAIYNGETYQSVIFKCPNPACMKILGVTFNQEIHTNRIINEVLSRISPPQIG